MKKVNKSQFLPITQLEKIGEFYLKREDLNPSGSAKDRAITKQLRTIAKNGAKKAVISTSGNAGISLAYWAKKFDIEPFIFASPKISDAKLKEIKKYTKNITLTNKAISESLKFAKKNSAVHLRQSKDPAALKGFENLGKEIAGQLKELGTNKAAIFFPVSSGTTLLGTTKGLIKSGIETRPFAIQSAAHVKIAQIWDKDFTPEERNLATSLVAKVLPRKKEIIKLISENNGGGAVVSSSEIEKWQKRLYENKVFCSFEGGLTLAGAEKISKKTEFADRLKICLITGKKYE